MGVLFSYSKMRFEEFIFFFYIIIYCNALNLFVARLKLMINIYGHEKNSRIAALCQYYSSQIYTL